MANTPLRVLCLGGGWAAIYMAWSMRGALRRGEIELTVVSRENFHTFHGFIAEMLTGTLQPNDLLTPARRAFKHATFLCAEVDHIDPTAQKVRVSRRIDGNPYELDYDHLVIALGTVDDLSRFPGLPEHTHKLKTFWECFKVRTHFLTMLEMAELETDPEARKKLLTFTIIGGGYGGIEVAAELNSFFRELAGREYPKIKPDEIKVIVVHSGPRILPELQQVQPKLVDYAEKKLLKAGLDLRCGVRIQSATAEEAILSDGTRIGTRTIVSSAGTALPKVLDDTPFPRDERGRLKMRADMRIEGFDNVWSAGDCAAVPHPHGGVCPTVAVYAMAGGYQIGVNLRRLTRGKKLQDYWFSGIGDACALGDKTAVTHLWGLRLYGFLAWVTWRSIFLFFIPTWERKLRIVADWFMAAIFGRDIVDVRIVEPHGVRSMMFEPGQPIVRQGEVGRSMYAIWKGDAEVVHTDADGVETVLATLGPGDHFGEVAVFENRRRTATVRALTRVEVLSIGRSEALALSSTVLPFGEVVRRGPKGGTAPDSPEA
jgi:NADH dehydrogenase